MKFDIDLTLVHDLISSIDEIIRLVDNTWNRVFLTLKVISKNGDD